VKSENTDIYVKLIDSATPLKLTTDPAPDFNPAWSPDGKFVAFERILSADVVAVILIPAIGGPEREVGRISAGSSKIAWSPDGKWLVASDKISANEPFALFVLSPSTGDKRKLTFPPARTYGDTDPAFSPDGLTIAFARSRDAFIGEIYLLSVSQDLTPQAQPKQLTNENTTIGGPVWTRNGRDIIFATTRGLRSSGLYRIAASGGRPEQLGIASDGWAPAISSHGNRLAYARPLLDVNIWRVQLPVAGGAKTHSEPIISSSRLEANAQYSPDGKRIAFASDRSGSMEIWVSDNQGSNAVQMTSLGRAESGTPRWSPDGRRIAFDWNVAGHWDIYTVSASGGNARRMTTDPFDHAIPSYSRDGKWLYFASSATGRNEIWRMPADGGTAVQVTKKGGHVAFESTDGKWLYYTKSDDTTSLWKMPAGGGEETQVAPSVQSRAFAVTDSGIYFIAPAKHGNMASIEFLSLKSNVPKTVLALTRPPWLGLTVSPENRSLLYTQYDQAGSDLMLIENFR
jgi:Tol biopolymer transport system component